MFTLETQFQEKRGNFFFFFPRDGDLEHSSTSQWDGTGGNKQIFENKFLPWHYMHSQESRKLIELRDHPIPWVVGLKSRVILVRSAIPPNSWCNWYTFAVLDARRYTANSDNLPKNTMHLVGVNLNKGDQLRKAQITRTRNCVYSVITEELQFGKCML